VELREKDVDLVVGAGLTLAGTCLLAVGFERAHRLAGTSYADADTLGFCAVILWTVGVKVRRALRSRRSGRYSADLDPRRASGRRLAQRIAFPAVFLLPIVVAYNPADLEYLGIAVLVAGITWIVLSRRASLPPLRGVAD
jgi:hypothetical protein